MRTFLSALAFLTIFIQPAMGEAAEKSIFILPGFPNNVGIISAHDLFPNKLTWRALICTKQICQLVNTKLKVEQTNQSIFSRPQQTGNTIANTLVYLAGVGQDNQLVETYYSPTKPRSALDATAGSIGIAFEMPKQGLTKIIPRWNKEKDDDRLNVYLEQGKKRQIVAYIPLSELSKSISIRDVLVWAGDLDGDGKLDLITRSTVDRAVSGVSVEDNFNKSLNLWLSSKAEAAQLVGLAKSLDRFEYQEDWEE